MAKVIEDRDLQDGEIKNNTAEPIYVRTYQYAGDFFDGHTTQPMYRLTTILVPPGHSEKILAELVPENRNP